MSLRTYRVIVGLPDGERRTLEVPAKTDVQAGDAAVPLMREGEFLFEVTEVDDPFQDLDAPPPGTQTHPDEPV
jgi:hypothetical protein